MSDEAAKDRREAGGQPEAAGAAPVPAAGEQKGKAPKNRVVLMRRTCRVARSAGGIENVNTIDLVEEAPFSV
jgi:hypothetical protein